jgi:hypothetical protein
VVPDPDFDTGGRRPALDHAVGVLPHWVVGYRSCGRWAGAAQEANLIRQVKPTTTYSPLGKQARIQGTVRVQRHNRQGWDHSGLARDQRASDARAIGPRSDETVGIQADPVRRGNGRSYDNHRR